MSMLRLLCHPAVLKLPKNNYYYIIENDLFLNKSMMLHFNFRNAYLGILRPFKGQGFDTSRLHRPD